MSASRILPMLWQGMIYNGIAMRRLFCLFCMVILLALPARAAEPYVVPGVSVDVTADSASAAKDQAIVDAQRKAFMNLATQLVPGGPIPNVSDKAIGDMVSDFHVEQEKFNTNEYTGTFTFRFRQNPVRAAFGAAAIPTPHELAQRNVQQPLAAAQAVPDGKGDIGGSVISNVAAQPLPVTAAEPVVTPATLTPPGKMGVLADAKSILVEISAYSPRELDMAQNQIARAPGVTKTELRSVSAANAVMLVSYQGELPQVLQSLTAHGVKLQSKAPTVPPLYTLLP